MMHAHRTIRATRAIGRGSELAGRSLAAALSCSAAAAASASAASLASCAWSGVRCASSWTPAESSASIFASTVSPSRSSRARAPGPQQPSPSAAASASIPARPSATSPHLRDRYAYVAALLQEANRTGSAVQLPQRVSSVRQKRPQPLPFYPNRFSPEATAAAIEAAQVQVQPVAPVRTPRPLTGRSTAAPSAAPSAASASTDSEHLAAISPSTATAAATSPTASLLQPTSHVSDLADAMAAQLAIVQPENPHTASLVILGTPNAGKSTLVNRLVHQKISAVSHKRNTTRTSVLGVATRDNRQLVVFDTPGVLPKLMSNKYQKELSTAAWDAAQGCDVALVIVDVVKKLSDAEYELLAKAKALKESSPDMKLILVLNKMDLCKPLSKGRTVAQLVQGLAPFDQTYFTSFEHNEKGVEQLFSALFDSTKPGDWEYPPQHATDQSPQELVNEVIREKIFHRVHQEIPYRVRISTTGWTPIDQDKLRIDCLLEVDSKQQKLILTGHNESMLRYITERALPEIEQLTKKKVYLFLKCTCP